MMVGPSTEEAQRTMSRQGAARSGKGAEGVGQAKKMATRPSQYVKYFLRDRFCRDGFRTQFWIEKLSRPPQRVCIWKAFQCGLMQAKREVQHISKLPSGKPIEGQNYTCVNPANIDNRSIGDWLLHDLISIFDSMREKITCKFHRIGIYLYLCW